MANSKLIIMLISDQTIPNVLFFKWYFKNYLQTCDVLFVSTQKMENAGKSEQIKNAISSLDKFIKNLDIIIVKENSLPDIEKKVNEFITKKKYDEIIANITGGTKLMSLGIYNECCKIENSEIFYQPINEDFQQIFPKQKMFPVSELLSLDEYMKAHGISYKANCNCVKDYEYNKSVYSTIIEHNRETIKQLNAIQNNPWFKNQFKKKEFLNFEEIEPEKFSTVNYSIKKTDICELIKKFGFESTKLSHAEQKYITGGWFEEFVYQKVKTEQKLDDDKIALDIAIRKNDDNNELDVAYINAKNQLTVIECKSFVDGKSGAEILNNALYKLQAIMKAKFGLNAQSKLFTMSTIDKENALNRAAEFKIDIVDGAKL